MSVPKNNLEVLITGKTKDFEKVKKKVETLVPKITPKKDFTTKIRADIYEKLSKALPEFRKKYEKALDELIKKTAEFEFAQKAAKDSMEQMGKGAGAAFEKLFASLGQDKLKNANRNFKTFAEGLETSFKDSVKSMAAGISTDVITSPFKELAKTAKNELSDIIKSAVFDPIKTHSKAALAGQNYTADLVGSKLAGTSGTVAALAALYTLAQGGSGSEAFRAGFKSGVTNFAAGGPFGALAVAAFQNREALQINENRDKLNEVVLDKFLGLNAFGKKNVDPHTRGLANIAASKRILEGTNQAIARALGAGRYPILDAPTLGHPSHTEASLDAFFRLNPFPAGTSENLLRDLNDDYGLTATRQSAYDLDDGDEEGRFYTDDTVRRVHKGEHTLNLNHPTSQRALNEAVERSVGPAVERAMGKSGGGQIIHNHFDMRGMFVLDDRTVTKLTDKIEDKQRSRRRYGRGSS
ncbi:MAG: hypothetical protein HOC91_03770 [Nitrospinaceae bacterium]|nr:hypothetical protein [Nitrospinaceae bacterium]